MKTAVSILHELMTQKKLPAPEYEFGDMVLGKSNIPEFSCTVTADNHSAVGKGSTKKEAKQNCVKNFLETYKCAEVILPTNEGDEDTAADGTGSPKAKKIKVNKTNSSKEFNIFGTLVASQLQQLPLDVALQLQDDIHKLISAARLAVTQHNLKQQEEDNTTNAKTDAVATSTPQCALTSTSDQNLAAEAP